MKKQTITILALSILFSVNAFAEYTIKIPVASADIKFVSVIKEGSSEPVQVPLGSSALCNQSINEIKAAVAGSAYNEIQFLNDVEYNADKNGVAHACEVSVQLPKFRSALCTGSTSYNNSALSFIHNYEVSGKGVLSINYKMSYYGECL